GPQKFSGVEPHGATGDEATLRKGQRPFHSTGADVVFLDPGRAQAQGGTAGEERRQREDVLPVQAALFPPLNEQQRGGQGARDGFGQQRGDEKKEGERVDQPLPPARLFGFRESKETEIRQRRRKIKNRGEDVLAFGDPGHRLHLDRVQGKNGRRQPGAGDAQSP